MENNTQTNQTRQFSKKAAYGIVGATALFGALLVSFPIILLPMGMAIGSLAFPVMLDIDKHGKDNILNRAWKELKEAGNIVKNDLTERAAAFKAEISTPEAKQNRENHLSSAKAGAKAALLGSAVAVAGAALVTAGCLGIFTVLGAGLPAFATAAVVSSVGVAYIMSYTANAMVAIKKNATKAPEDYKPVSGLLGALAPIAGIFTLVAALNSNEPPAAPVVQPTPQSTPLAIPPVSAEKTILGFKKGVNGGIL